MKWRMIVGERGEMGNGKEKINWRVDWRGGGRYRAEGGADELWQGPPCHISSAPPSALYLPPPLQYRKRKRRKRLR